MSKAPLFVVSDEAVLNSYGFCVLTSGINTEERFKDNPICLNNHNNDTRHVLGSWIDIEVKDGKLYMRPVFDTKDPDGVEVVRKVLSGTIKASSIGIMFDPVDMVLMNDRLTLTKCILFEVSIVAVPSNANAIALFNMAGQQLSEQEIKSLCLSIQPEKHFNNNTMKLLTAHLQLAENATEEAILSAIKAVELKLTESQNTNATLKTEIETLKSAAKEKNTAELTAELDAAVKDGRIDEAGKAPILELAHESAMKLLKSLPKRKSVANEIEAGEKTPEEMYGKLSWSELDKTNKLGKLKADFPDYYAERFEQHFGKKPTK
ncbi:HK97 family phage prohead protease [Chryseobacterium cucumeris]|uniref:HK97 family phage prohead protease n=1 Tax=Chryseobacterium cucumeris TaxID=1813611 RepID=UPI003209F574